MTVNIEGSALSIPTSLDSLRTTPLIMHRIVFRLANTRQWYDVMGEARQLYARQWRSQPHTKRKLERFAYTKQLVDVWFEVPDPKFATWCAIKLGVEAIQVVAK